jgi:hypothetical protein
MAAEVKVAMADPFDRPLLARGGRDEVASLQALDRRVASMRADQRACGEAGNRRQMIGEGVKNGIVMAIGSVYKRCAREGGRRLAYPVKCQSLMAAPRGGRERVGAQGGAAAGQREGGVRLGAAYSGAREGQMGGWGHKGHRSTTWRNRVVVELKSSRECPGMSREDWVGNRDAGESDIDNCHVTRAPPQPDFRRVSLRESNRKSSADPQYIGAFMQQRNTEAKLRIVDNTRQQAT